MLESLRKSLNSLPIKIFLGLLILSFAVWGVSDVFRGAGATNVAKIGEREVSIDDYARELDSFLRSQNGIGLTEARALGYDQIILSRMTTRAALDEEARVIGLSASDAAVAEEIRDTAAFQDEFSRFNRVQYDFALRRIGMSESEYEARAREDIARDLLVDSVEAGLTPPRAMAEAIQRKRSETRRIDYLRIDADAAPEIDDPDDATLTAYIDENAAAFTAPETRAVTYIALTPESMTDAVEVDEDTLRALYDARIESYRTPERRLVEQIVFDDEDAARDAVRRIGEGARFSDIAEERGLSRDDISLGLVQRSELPDDVAAVAFGVDGPQVTDPVSTAFGWTVVNVRAIRYAEERTFEEVRDELRIEAAMDGARERVIDLAVQAEDELAGGAPLEDVATTLDVPLGRIAAIDAEGFGPDGLSIDDLPAIPEFVTRIFTTDRDTLPSLIEAENGAYYALRIDDVTEAALRPLDIVRGRAVEAWKRVQRAEALKDQTKAILERIATGETLEAIAAADDMTLHSEGPLGRGAQTADLTAELVGKLFDEALNDPISAATPDGDGRVVAVTAEIITPEGEEFDTAVTRASDLYTRQMAQDAVEILARNALSVHGSVLYPAGVEAAMTAVAQSRR